MNIFAFTEFCLAPGFISINRDDNGQHSITVRETGKDGNIGPVVTFNCTRDVLQMMAVAISKAEKPESVPGICDLSRAGAAMNDLLRCLRGQRIDGRSTDEIMLQAADEIEQLRRFLREYCDSEFEEHGMTCLVRATEKWLAK